MFAAREPVILQRDLTAVIIPAGEKILLRKGAHMTITQSLGGYTLMDEDGALYRVSESEADALGLERRVEASSHATLAAHAAGEPIDQATTETLVWDALKTCYDPEIPVNIVELGLVYMCELFPLGEVGGDGGFRLEVRMTLTAPGCGMGPVLREDVCQKTLSIPGIKEANVELVFDPAWDQSRMSEAARLQLGFM